MGEEVGRLEVDRASNVSLVARPGQSGVENPARDAGATAGGTVNARVMLAVPGSRMIVDASELDGPMRRNASGPTSSVPSSVAIRSSARVSRSSLRSTTG